MIKRFARVMGFGHIARNFYGGHSNAPIYKIKYRFISGRF